MKIIQQNKNNFSNINLFHKEIIQNLKMLKFLKRNLKILTIYFNSMMGFKLINHRAIYKIPVNKNFT